MLSAAARTSTCRDRCAATASRSTSLRRRSRAEATLYSLHRDVQGLPSVLRRPRAVHRRHDHAPRAGGAAADEQPGRRRPKRRQSGSACRSRSTSRSCARGYVSRCFKPATAGTVVSTGSPRRHRRGRLLRRRSQHRPQRAPPRRPGGRARPRRCRADGQGHRRRHARGAATPSTSPGCSGSTALRWSLNVGIVTGVHHARLPRRAWRSPTGTPRR